MLFINFTDFLSSFQIPRSGHIKQNNMQSMRLITLNSSYALLIMKLTIFVKFPTTVCNSLGLIFRGINKCGANSMPRFSDVILFAGSCATLCRRVSRHWRRKRFSDGSNCNNNCKVCSCLLSSSISVKIFY